MIQVIKALGEFVLRAQVYFVVIALLLWSPNNTNELFGYLAMFIATSYTAALLLFIFRSSLRVVELIIPLGIFYGVGYLLVDYFYLSGRTDLYWMGLYATMAAIVETIYFLYHHPSLERAFYRFSFLAHLLGGAVALGIVFLLHDMPHTVSEFTAVGMVLVSYIVFGISTHSLYALKSLRWISDARYNLFLSLIMIVCGVFVFVFLTISAVMDIVQRESVMNVSGTAGLQVNEVSR